MTRTLNATYDGQVFKPDEPLHLPPNTRVVITIDTAEAKARAPQSFLKTAVALQLDGPSDWSSRLDDYLYGDKTAP